jgi:hypothetical protein
MDGDVTVWVADACVVVGWPRMNLLYRLRRGFSIVGRCMHMPYSIVPISIYILIAHTERLEFMVDGWIMALRAELWVA